MQCDILTIKKFAQNVKVAVISTQSKIFMQLKIREHFLMTTTMIVMYEINCNYNYCKEKFNSTITKVKDLNTSAAIS